MSPRGSIPLLSATLRTYSIIRYAQTTQEEKTRMRIVQTAQESNVQSLERERKTSDGYLRAGDPRFQSIRRSRVEI